MEQKDKHKYMSLVDQYLYFIESEDIVNRKVQIALAKMHQLEIYGLPKLSKPSRHKIMEANLGAGRNPESNKQDWINLIEIFDFIVSKDIQNKKHFERVVWTLLHTSMCYQQIKDFLKATDFINEAEKWLVMLESKKIKIN